MARLTAQQRRNLPGSAYVYPKTKAYPIHDRKHARAALSLAARKDTSGSLAKVKAAVKRRFPGLVKG